LGVHVRFQLIDDTPDIKGVIVLYVLNLLVCPPTILFEKFVGISTV
jgi:hypothetical protein